MVTCSVIIPTFNRSHSIIESVNSVLRQTFGDLEVIVVDDCSSDDSAKLVSAIEDPRVRLIVHDARGGASAARNTGMRAATGRFVAFQDSDDEWLPTKLAKQLAVLQAKSAGWVAAYCGMLVVRDLDHCEGARTRIRYIPDSRLTALEGNLAEAVTAKSFISTQTLILRRDALHKIGEFDESLSGLEDWDFILRVARVGMIAFVDEPLVLQRFSSDSITRSKQNRVDAHVRIMEKLASDTGHLPAGMGRHYYTISGGYRVVGDYAASLQYIRRSIAAEPQRVKYWIAAVYVMLLLAKSWLARLRRARRS